MKKSQIRKYSCFLTAILSLTVMVAYLVYEEHVVSTQTSPQLIYIALFTCAIFCFVSSIVYYMISNGGRRDKTMLFTTKAHLITCAIFIALVSSVISITTVYAPQQRSISAPTTTLLPATKEIEEKDYQPFEHDGTIIQEQ